MTLLTILNNKRIVLSVLSVHGSARTAKVEAIRAVRRFYRERLVDSKPFIGRKEIDRLCRSMEDSLDIIVNIDY